jgi:hypothetical protein
MAAFPPGLDIAFACDGDRFTFRFSYESIIVKYFFPNLSIVDNRSSVKSDVTFIKKDIENVLDPTFMSSMIIESNMSHKQKTLMLLCGIDFFIFVVDHFSKNIEGGCNTNLMMLIFFFFIDNDHAQNTYGHINWSFCTYHGINKAYGSDPDVIKLLNQIGTKMNIFKRMMSRSLPEALSVSMELRKIRMISAYNSAKIAFIPSKKGEGISVDVIDSFLYGVIVYTTKETPDFFSLFGGPLGIIKEIDLYLLSTAMTVYEKAFFDNIFSLFSSFCLEYKSAMIRNLDRIISICDSIQCEYANGVIMCCLELFYFLRISKILMSGDIYTITEKLCSCCDLSTEPLSLYEWQHIYHFKLSEFVMSIRSKKQMDTSVPVSHINYDQSMLERIKRHIISFLSMSGDDTVSADMIHQTKNELQLIALFMTHSNASMHIRTIFISLVFYFVQVYSYRINQVYRYLATIYKTTEKWHRRVYIILGHKDGNFFETIDRLRDECTVYQLEEQTNITHSGQIHVCFENAIYVLLYIKSMIEIFFRHTPMSIAEIHRFRMIDFTGIFPNGGIIENNIRAIVSKVIIHSRLQEEHIGETFPYTNMTMEKLMLGDITSYVHRTKKQYGYLIDDLFMMHKDNKTYKKAVMANGGRF